MKTEQTEQTEQTEPKTETKKCTPDELHADAMCEAVDWLMPVDSRAIVLIWEYFRDGKDQLALMLLQAFEAHRLAGHLEEIEIKLNQMTDDDGDLRVFVVNRE